MANLPSVEKRHRQSLKRRARNVAERTRLKSAVKSVREAIAKKDHDQARKQLIEATRVIDMAASKGVIPKATASRRISRLAQAVNHTAPAK